MSKGTKQQFKQFKINSQEDALLVLSSLIIPVTIDLEKYENYSVEAQSLIEQYSGQKVIPADVYDSVHDKILYQQRELLRFIADHQSSSFSYIEVRDIFLKRKYLSRELPEESKRILSELLDVRNWTFHNAQSMLVAQKEIANKSIPPELKGSVSVIPQLNPVVIRKIKSYNIMHLMSFVAHNTIRAKQFRTILDEMKADYQDMFDTCATTPYMMFNGGFNKKVQYIEVEEASWLDNHDIDIANLSMGIQKVKYDGTSDSFYRLIHCPNPETSGKSPEK